MENEALIRMICFGGIFVLMAVAELLMPRRDLVANKARRWFTNLALVAIDTLALRLLFPVLAIGVAEKVSANGWGVFALLNWPFWLEVTLAAILLDLAIYGQHVVSHKVPMLWAIHKVHHADRDIDVTTGIRFHPVEICLSMLYKFAIIAVIGAPALAVFLFEVLLNGTAMFNHANVNLPRPIDAALRLIVVTPDMHRVHHSEIRTETDSNYGFNLSIWDRIFGTYIPQPREGHTAMVIGLKDYRGSGPSNLMWCLVLPFRRKATQQSESVSKG